MVDSTLGPKGSFSLPVLGQAQYGRDVTGGASISPSTALTPAKDSFSFSGHTSKKSPEAKFSLGKAGRNFGRGLMSPIVAPIKMMMESPKNFLIGASVLGAGGLLLATFGAALTPFLVAGGLAIGGYQGIKGLKQFSQAKTVEEKEAAFYEFGASTASIGLSSLNIGALKRLLPGSKAAPVVKEESKIADLGTKVTGFHAAVEPLEQFGKVSGALGSAKGESTSHG